MPQTELRPDQVDETLKETEAHGSIKLPISTYMDNCVIYHALYTHWHEEMEIIYIEWGSGFARVNKETHRIKRGDLLFINCNEIHNMKTDPNNPLYYKSIVFHPSFLSGPVGDLFQERVVTPLLEGQLGLTSLIPYESDCYHQIYSYFDQIYKCYNEASDFYYVRLKELFFGMFYELMQLHLLVPFQNEQYKNFQLIRTVIDYISENYAEPLSTEELVGLTNYSESYFMKLFKQYTGKSLVSYINDYRIEKAKSLLLSSDLSVTDVALSVGFNNTSYFIKKFKEAGNVSPYKFKINRQLQN